MPRQAAAIDLSPEERGSLERLRRCASTPQALARRARMILMAGDGAGVVETAEQICAIVALACERPAESDRPVTHWSQQELADEAMKRGIVERISQRSVGRFLKKNRTLSPIFFAFG